jgi:hypothetical protein
MTFDTNEAEGLTITSVKKSGPNPSITPVDPAARVQVACGADTVKYLHAKGNSHYYYAELGDTAGYKGFSQYYPAPQAMSIKGVKFFAVANVPNGINVPVTVKITTATGAKLPTTTVLGTTTININNSGISGSTDNWVRYASFSSPVSVSAAYCVVLEYSATPQSIWLALNDAGLGENLCGAKSISSGGAWGSLLTAYGYDYDALLYPLVTFDYASPTFTIAPPCLSTAGNVIFDITYPPIADDKFYSWYAFDNQPERVHFWDHGDGYTSYEGDHSHYYSTVGVYPVTVRDSLYGWTRVCAATPVTNNVNASPTAGFSHVVNGGQVTFTNTSAGSPAPTYSWDFGDGGTSTGASPSHTYSTTGTYTVCLTATNTCGSNNYCENITILTTALEPSSAAWVTLSPNPSTGRVHLEATVALENATVKVYNTLGQEVSQYRLGSISKGEKHLLDLQALEGGIYLVQINSHLPTTIQKLWIR